VFGTWLFCFLAVAVHGLKREKHANPFPKVPAGLNYCTPFLKGKPFFKGHNPFSKVFWSPPHFFPSTLFQRFSSSDQPFFKGFFFIRSTLFQRFSSSAQPFFKGWSSMPRKNATASTKVENCGTPSLLAHL
jgi:hypothetical protein